MRFTEGVGLEYSTNWSGKSPPNFLGIIIFLGNFMRRIFERAGRGAKTERGFMGTGDGVKAPGRVSLLNSTFYSS